MSDLVTRKESKRWPGLFVKKYTRRVFYDNLWHTNDELLEARGHVETEDGREVVRPFTKIFNRFENDTDIPLHEECVAVRKVNGFMAAATWVEEVVDVVVSTTGSLDSDYVKLAEKYIDDHVKGCIKALASSMQGTFLFEICDPSDPHIIPERPGAYLIGYRATNSEGPYVSSAANETNLDQLSLAMGVKRPSWGVSPFWKVWDLSRQCSHEGFIVYGQQSKTALKIKSPYYLALKMAARRKDIMSLNKSKVDEEFYPLIDHLTEMGEAFTMMDEQERLTYMRDFLCKA